MALVRTLQGTGCRLGILTRNVRSLAQVTLQAIGLGDVFAEDDIIGRDEAEPKPSPAGLQYFRGAGGGTFAGGDGGRLPLRSGMRPRAGSRTLLVNAPTTRGPAWPVGTGRLRGGAGALARLARRPVRCGGSHLPAVNSTVITCIVRGRLDVLRMPGRG
ncbi:hypothetical protein QT383_19635 [Stenotrophomonas rhizophila]